MSRTGRRTWIKLHCHGRLHGSIVYQLKEAEQSVFDKLLCFAGECNRDGQISDNDGRPFPRAHIAHELHTTTKLLESTLDKCITEGRITENGAGLYITNWATYQSEYQRQKPYREEKKGKKIRNTYKKCPECGWKGKTDADQCPDCDDVKLEVDYQGGEQGKNVRQ